MGNVEGFIYVAANSLFPGYVKIGRTKNVKQRMKKLGTGVPKPYVVLHSELVINASFVETELHHEFEHLQENGEWFKIKDINLIKDKISSIQKDIRRNYDIEHGETIREKYERICGEFGVGGYSGFELNELIESFSRLDADKIENVIKRHAEALLDYHPSINECW